MISNNTWRKLILFTKLFFFSTEWTRLLDEIAPPVSLSCSGTVVAQILPSLWLKYYHHILLGHINRICKEREEEYWGRGSVQEIWFLLPAASLFVFKHSAVCICLKLNVNFQGEKEVKVTTFISSFWVDLNSV